MQQGLRLCAFI